jgi:cell fate regulator YaaT (PSP1 superfamily)
VNGKPSGCRSNGSCSNGGCNRLNVFDWLADIPVADEIDASRFVEVSFKNGAHKEFYRNIHHLLLDTHDIVVVESGTGGYDVGVVSLSGELVKLQMKRKRVPENSDDVKGVIRKANEYDLIKWEEARAFDRQTMIRARAIARQMNLNMKIGDVEYQGDGKKATFYYTSDERVDFRELIKVFAKEFHIKVAMHQIGARQEAGRLGGIGSCGRELCCSTWLTDFKTVSTTAARYQQLSINQAKLSGQCGRLKCCLNYELDTYLDALHDFPQHVDKIETEAGIAFLQKTDIFKRLLWFSYRDSTVYHPLAVERVKEIAEMNKNGNKPTDLGALKLMPVKETYEFTDVVGQTTLATLEKNPKKKKRKNKGNSRPQNN